MSHPAQQKRNRAIRPAISALFESLEQRRMLAIHPALWTLHGTSHDDTISIRVNPNQANQLQALLNDRVVSVRNAKAVSGIRIVAARGDDAVSIDLGPDYKNIPTTINGGGGDDSLDGGAGADKLVGGPGDDSLSGGLGDDVETGDSGDDMLAGDEGDDNLDGNLGDDTLAGGMGDDDLDGGTGDDQISGGWGDDGEQGGAGTDTLAGGDGADSLNGQQGKDVIFHEPKDYWKYNRLDISREDVHANPLQQVQDTETLRQTLIDSAVKQYQGQYGQPVWWYWRVPTTPIYMNDTGALAYDASRTPQAQGSAASDPSHSNTNNQVTGVDEQDIVNNDGNFIYLIQDGKLVILKSWPAQDTSIVSTTAIDGYASGLYLDGDRVTVVSSAWVTSPAPMGADAQSASLVYWGGKSQTIVTVFNVSDRSNPTLISKTTLDGSASDSRDINGHIYLVLDNSIALPRPALIPRPDTGSSIDAAPPADLATSARIARPIWYTSSDYVYESEADYRARLEAMDLSELLPTWSSTAGDATTTGALADPSHLYLPSADRDLSRLFSVVTINAADDAPAPLSSTSIVGFSGEVYASSDSLYVTSQAWDSPMGAWDGDYRTDIYKFALNPDSVTYDGNGQVPGWAINRFAMDEQGDTFRIATTTEQNGQSNNLFILQDTGDTLDPIGGITGLAFDERIQAARFVGDTAYLVTFHQTDPLFSIDLSDPTNPTVAGILEMPGYSSYLQPIDATHMIGLGRDADAQGHVKGLKVSLFDVSDIHNPKLVDTFKFATTSPSGQHGWWDSWSSSPAEWDPHAFSYFPDQHILAVPVLDWGWWHGDARLEVLSVDENAGFVEIGQVQQDSQVLRSLQIGDYLYSLSNTDLKIVSLTDPADEIADVPLPQDTPSSGGVIPIDPPVVY